MDASAVSYRQVTATARDLARLVLTIGENRFELLTLEVQEERERLLRALFLALCTAILGLLAGLAFTAAVVVLFWSHSPVMVLLIVSGVYAVAGICLLRRLAGELHDRQTLSASLEQLRKDRACLEKIIT